MLPATVDDSAYSAFQNESGPGVRRETHPTAFLSRRRFGHDKDTTAVVIATEIKTVFDKFLNELGK